MAIPIENPHLLFGSILLLVISVGLTSWLRRREIRELRAELREYKNAMYGWQIRVNRTLADVQQHIEETS